MHIHAHTDKIPADTFTYMLQVIPTALGHKHTRRLTDDGVSSHFRAYHLLLEHWKWASTPD